MEEKIEEIICEVLKIDYTTLTQHYDDRTIWDSLGRVEILFAIEDEFDIQFSEEELAILVTPRLLKNATMGKAE